MNIQSTTPCTGEKTCSCGCCGGLECLCRPRFFAGQLLTEEDLNRLDHYVRGRHRQHNLTVHGHGVSGGLKVLCDPCGQVLVSRGHAISPCGEDIVVCDDVAVPVCDLIAKCRKSERPRHDCDPPRRMPGASDCEDLEEEWVLAIKYDERPTRGVVPLRTAGASACASCGCGGGGAGCDCDDCGCDACCEPKAKEPPKPRAAPATCEPTVICEGYRFCVYRKPERDPRPGTGVRDDPGIFDPDAPLIQALECCMQLLIEAIPVMPPFQGDVGPNERRQLHDFCCRLKNNLSDYFRRHPHTNCEVVSRLAALRCPDPNDPEGFDQTIVEALLALFAVWLDAIRQCFCLALLPPAPEPSCDDRVPLATVRVTARDCRVLSVCNWTTERDLLMSWTALEYWIGGLGLWSLLREALDAFCCNNLLDIFDDVLRDDDIGIVEQPGGPEAEIAEQPTVSFDTVSEEMVEEEMVVVTGRRPQSFADHLDQTFARVAPRMAVDLPRLDIAGIVADQAGSDAPRGLSDILAASSPRFRFAGRPGPLTVAERESLPGALTMEFVGKPLIAGLFGDRIRPHPDPDAVKDEAEGAEEIGDDARAEELRTMHEEMERQRLDIALLKQALAAGPQDGETKK